MIKQEFHTITSPHGNITLQVCPGIGGSITRFMMEDEQGQVELMRPYDHVTPLDANDPMAVLNTSSFALTPWSNRIGNGILKHDGETFIVGTRFMSRDHPNHGDGLTSPWNVEVDDYKIVMTLKSEGPLYAYEAVQTLTIDDFGLVHKTSIRNLSHMSLPFGLGHHPYFPRTDMTRLQFNATGIWQSEDMLPTKLIKPKGKFDFSAGKLLKADKLNPPEAGDDKTAYIDHCYSGWDQWAYIDWMDKNTRLTIQASSNHGKFVVYVPNGNAFCAEPVTHDTNGFNLAARGVKNTGTQVLQHGETMTGVVGYRATRHML